MWILGNKKKDPEGTSFRIIRMKTDTKEDARPIMILSSLVSFLKRGGMT